MTINPYESPSEPKPDLDSQQSRTTTPVQQRPMLGLLRACSIVVGMGAGSLMGMALMVFYVAQNLNQTSSARSAVLQVVVMGGGTGAVIALAGIRLFRAGTNAARRKVNSD